MPGQLESRNCVVAGGLFWDLRDSSGTLLAPRQLTGCAP
jgi:hypothetical protein